MASRFGQRRLKDSTGSSEHRDTSSTSLSCNSAIWWEDKEEQFNRGDSLRKQLRTMDDQVATLHEMLSCERTKCSRLQLRCKQQEAELRRREVNINRMKEKLSLFTDKHKDKAPSIKILNIISARGKKEQLSAKKQEEGAVRLMLERREAELREAMKLRHSLASLLHALRCDMEQTLFKLEGSEDETVSTDKRLDQAERALGDHVTGGVVQSWRLVQKKLSRLTCEGTTEFGSNHDKLMAQLENELKQSQHLVQMQQQLLQESIGSPLPSELGDCYFLEEWDRLQEHWAEFELQMRTFERERQAFTDAAIRLSHERHDFEQRKAAVLKQQFLCDSPVFGKVARSNTRKESISPSISGINSLNTFESPITAFPAALSKAEDVPGDSGRVTVHTPSTPELYTALNLSYNHSRNAEDEQSNPLTLTAPTLDWSF